MTTKQLSPRESQVLQLLADGVNGTEAAEQLGLAPSTVVQHKTKIFTKLGARTTAGAVAIGLREGIIS